MASINPRYLATQIEQDLRQKMVFVAGPRQVGKTTLAKKLLDAQQGYLNWDILADREAILNQQLPPCEMWVFDELHKYTHWRNFLKGVYDQFAEDHRILVTGSARLDYYRRGGDSLQGRYHLLRLLPLSVAELSIHSQQDLEQLLQLGGFPEPFFSSSDTEANRWTRAYRQRVLEEDMVSLENVRDVGLLELLMHRLPQCVASPLSINSLAEDLQVSHRAVTNWLAIFERIYAIFRITPFGGPTIRATKKAQKHYHYDWNVIDDKGARFENMVAVHLLKWVYYEVDTKARDLELRYFRDADGKEVDFVIIEKGKPIMGIECKYADEDLHKGLRYFKKHYPNCQTWQIAMDGNKDYLAADGTRVCPAITFLKELV